jgi:hypothetical protein
MTGVPAALGVEERQEEERPTAAGAARARPRRKLRRVNRPAPAPGAFNRSKYHRE